MWRESLIFERDGSWMRFGLPTKKSQIWDLLGSSIDRARTTELELKIDHLFLKDKRTS